MKKFLLVLGAFAAPAIAFAQTPLELFLVTVGNVVSALVPIVSVLAIVYFFYGLAKYILSAGDETKAQEGKSIMIWGVLALFVMVTIFGLIAFIQNTIGNTETPTVQDIQVPGVIPNPSAVP